MTRWNRLFQINERSHLEENLNVFARDYPDYKVERIWTENGLWFAHVTYTIGEQPTYFKPETSEDF